MSKQILLDHVAARVINQIKKRMEANRFANGRKKDGGRKSLIESRKLFNSITYQIEGNSVKIGSNQKYAKIQNEGGVIKPVNAKYLAIPIHKAAKAKRPEEFENTFIAKGVIFLKRSNGKDPLPLYVLKKQVTIPKTSFLSIQPEDRTPIKHVIETYYEQQLRAE